MSLHRIAPRITRLFWRYATVRALIVCALMPCAFAPQRAMAIEEQTLSYAASYEKIKIGTVEIAIEKTADGYAVTSTVKPNALAKLFGEPRAWRQTGFGECDGRLIPLGGVEIMRDKDGDQTERRFSVDCATRSIELADKQPTKFKRAAQLTDATFPLTLMATSTVDNDALTHLTGIDVLEVGARRVRNYRYESPESLGKHGWKITRRRIDRPRDSVSVWLSRADAPVVQKIVVVKKDKTTILELLDR